MRIIVAPDKFKGSAEADEVAAALAAGLRSAATAAAGIDVVEIPVADGGEGTVAAALGAGFAARTLTVTGPAGDPVTAAYALRGATAVIEMSQASGLDLLPRDRHGQRLLDPLGATSHGTGELIAHALSQGARRIVLGVGGSACTDGGAGMLTALGARFLDADGQLLGPGGGPLRALSRVDLSGVLPEAVRATIVLASDVDNPLLGEHGAAAVFGPQKGAGPAEVTALDRGLERLRDALGEVLGPDAVQAARSPGAGAAGGMGYGALTVLGALRRPGIDVVLEFTRLRERIRGADLVITGEGSLDAQSLRGKTPLGVLRCAQEETIAVVAVCGRSLLPAEQLHEAGFAAVHALRDRAPDARTSMAEAPRLLREVGAEIGRRLTEPRGPAPTTAPVATGTVEDGSRMRRPSIPLTDPTSTRT